MFFIIRCVFGFFNPNYFVNRRKRKMKKIIVAVTLNFISMATFAGFLPITECSNLNGNIKLLRDPNVGLDMITIVTKEKPNHEEVTFKRNDLRIKENIFLAMETEKTSSYTETVTFKQIILEKNDGSVMPSAWNKNAGKDGSLTDYFICRSSQVFGLSFRR